MIQRIPDGNIGICTASPQTEGHFVLTELLDSRVAQTADATLQVLKEHSYEIFSWQESTLWESQNLNLILHCPFEKNVQFQV